MSRPLPDEPTMLRAELRRLAGEDPVGAKPEIVRRLALYFLSSWGEEAASPESFELVSAVLRRCSYETFLWVMGDRTWDHLADTVAGRVRRRSGGSALGGSAGDATAAS